MIERIVENWLTNATERSFQIPFCQLLSSQGEKLLYIASHGQFEKGKDVITELPSGRLRAYQMKAGDIKLAQWRDIDKQVNNLVELPIHLPAVASNEWHEPYLVTNGRVEDTVLDYINTANEGWLRRSFPHPLRTLEKSNLVRQFTELHGTFLPKETRDFQAFLEDTLNLSAPTVKRLDAARAIASCLLLTSYILGDTVRAENHWPQFEAWTMVCSYVVAMATKYALDTSSWKASYDLALLSARRALDALVKECEDRRHFIEGDWLADGYFYSGRQTLLIGMIAAWSLNQRRVGTPQQFPLEFFHKAIRLSFYWGEGATPFLALTALDLEMRCLPREAEQLMLEILNIAGQANQRGNRGVPDIFVPVEDALAFQHRLKPYEQRSYAGFSYVIEPVTEYLARRWRRQGLARYWRGLTQINLMTSIPNQDWEWYRWRAEDLELASRRFPEPQSWQLLREHAETRSAAELPDVLKSEPEFLSYFVLVFPHRFNVRTMRGLEAAFGAW